MPNALITNFTVNANLSTDPMKLKCFYEFSKGKFPFDDMALIIIDKND